MMDFSELKYFIVNNESMKLIRANNSYFIISFLYNEFKIKSNGMPIIKSNLIENLTIFIEDNNYNNPDDEELLLISDNENKAKKYIDFWTNKKYIIQYIDENNNEVCDLTSNTEKIFSWLSNILITRDFVGTESRFKDVFNKLQEIIQNSQENREIKLKELKKEKKEIEQKIKDLIDGKEIEIFDNTQIKSRFEEVNKLARDLLYDFKEIEENFSKIKTEIQEKEIEKDFSKGKMIEYTLDSFHKLENSDQGKSFREFWEFLNSKNKKDELRLLIDEAITILDSKQISANKQFLKTFDKPLYIAALRVNKKKDKLNSKLSKIISTKNLLERKYALNLIKEIKSIAIKNKEQLANSNIGIEISTKPNLKLPFERSLQFSQQETLYDEIPTLLENNFSIENLDQINSLFYINKSKLKENIYLVLKTKKEVTLYDLLKIYPLEKGFGELLGYFSLAFDSNFKCKISKDKVNSIIFDKENYRALNVPEVIFSN